MCVCQICKFLNVIAPKSWLILEQRNRLTKSSPISFKRRSPPQRKSKPPRAKLHKTNEIFGMPKTRVVETIKRENVVQFGKVLGYRISTTINNN